MLKELPMIKEIRADFNQIGKIDTLTFSSNPSLKLINLQVIFNKQVIKILLISASGKTIVLPALLQSIKEISLKKKQIFLDFKKIKKIFSFTQK